MLHGVVGGNGPWPSMSAGYFAWTKRELAKVRLRGKPPVPLEPHLQWRVDVVVGPGVQPGRGPHKP